MLNYTDLRYEKVKTNLTFYYLLENVFDHHYKIGIISNFLKIRH